MINRVYFFNRNIAKSNKCEYSSTRWFIKFFGGILTWILVIKVVQLFFTFKHEEYFVISLLPILIGYEIFIHYVTTNAALAQIRAFYSDVFGNVYFLDNNNNGKSQFLMKSYGRTTRSMSFIVGAVSATQTIEEQTNFMQNPDNSVKLLEESFRENHVSSYNILNVYKIKEERKKIKLICDCKCLDSGKIKRKKHVTIYKVYIGLEELMELLKKRVVQ